MKDLPFITELTVSKQEIVYGGQTTKPIAPLLNPDGGVVNCFWCPPWGDPSCGCQPWGTSI